MNLFRLSAEEQRATGGATHRANITHADLTEATVNTAQVIQLAPVINGSLVKVKGALLKTPFKNSADAAFNTTAVTVGDGNSADRFLTSTELNANGAYVTAKAGVAGDFAYTGADTVDITFNAMAAKALSSLDTGELDVFLALVDLNSLTTPA